MIELAIDIEVQDHFQVEDLPEQDYLALLTPEQVEEVRMDLNKVHSMLSQPLPDDVPDRKEAEAEQADYLSAPPKEQASFCATVIGNHVARQMMDALLETIAAVGQVTPGSVRETHGYL